MDEQKIWFHFERDWEIYVLKVKVWVFVSLVPQFTLYIISGVPVLLSLSLRSGGKGKEPSVQSLKSKVQTVKGTEMKVQQN